LKIREFARSKERIIQTLTPQKGTLGLAITKYQAPNGKIINITQHYALSDDHEGSGLIVDMKYARLRPYGTKGAFRYLTDQQENDRAGIADEWQIIASLEVPRVEPHGWIHT